MNFDKRRSKHHYIVEDLLFFCSFDKITMLQRTDITEIYCRWKIQHLLPTARASRRRISPNVKVIDHSQGLHEKCTAVANGHRIEEAMWC